MFSHTISLRILIPFRLFATNFGGEPLAVQSFVASGYGGSAQARSGLLSVPRHARGPHLPSPSTLGRRSTTHRGPLILTLTMSGREISPGTVITLTDGRQGTVRFIGITSFAVGDWIGVELTDATGKNDGAVQGERYFECEPGFGMFIRPTAIGSVVQQPPRESKQTARTGPNAPASRQSMSAGSKRPPGLPPNVVKRQSTNATGTPTPAPKMAPRPSLRVRFELTVRSASDRALTTFFFLVADKVTDQTAFCCF